MRHKTSYMTWLFIVLAVAIGVSTLATYWIGFSVIQTNRQVIHHRALIAHLDDLLSTLKDAETGERGYLLTGEEKYLEPYTTALARVQGEQSTLRGDMQTGDLPEPGVTHLLDLTGRRLAELDQTIRRQREQGLAPAMDLVRLNIGKQTMDQIRQQVAELVSTEERTLADLDRHSTGMTMARTWTFVGTGLGSLAFVVWAAHRIGTEIRRRDAVAEELAEQKELLGVTLASIGDAVITTDTQGRITFLNAMAEATTGWSATAALGLPCSKVFRIINEDSRQPIESPVEKVLHLGTVVGLANHTLLIRKNGAEVPIDDSGAPIRHHDNSVRGVVLIFRDFSDHKHKENALKAATVAAEKANRAKDQFLATLSHELRTPLTPVLATLSSWEASTDLPAAFRRDSHMLARNIELEARLIDDLLDLTRIMKGKLALSKESADLHDLLTSVTGIVRPDMDAKHIHFTLQMTALRHFVNGDTVRLHQVVWNLLKNAVKFTPDGGTIALTTANESEGSVTLTVTDTGIGIGLDLQARLFQPFAQGSEPMVQRLGGLGLGLAIAKSLVEAHGGSISVASAGTGKGATFTVRLPTIAAPPKATAPAPAHLLQTALRPLSILLVEDHADTAAVMGRLLTGLGHRVQIAGTVAAGLRLAQQCPFDLLLSDIGLPDGTGLDLLEKLRTIRPIPAVALTGFGMEEDIARSRAAGFKAHLTKPVNFRKLQDVLDQVAEGVARS